MEFPANDADWITACATVAAAIGTVGALIFSAKAAKAASGSAEVANKGLQAQTRPLLLDVPPPGVHGLSSGRGAARIEHAELTLHTGDTHRQWDGQALPAGEDLWITGEPVFGEPFIQSLGRTPSPLHDLMPLIFTVVYVDIDGSQRQRLELGIGSRGPDSAWRVIQTAHVSLET